MRAEFTKLPNSEVQFVIELEAAELDVYENEAAKLVSEKVDIAGFRRGQAPKAFVISQIGPDAFFQEVLNVALPRSYYDALKQHNVLVISRPDIKIVSRAPLKYEARAALFPEFEIKGLEAVTVPHEPVSVTDKEIDEVVSEMRRYRATFKPLERDIAKGDRVEINFQGYDEQGVALTNTKSANHPLFVGEGSLVPGFEEHLLGMKPGEKKAFHLDFPKDFHHEPLRGKKVKFEVDVIKAEETLLPEITEEFITQILGEKKSAEEFRDIVRRDVEGQKTMEARRKRENVLLEKLLKEAKFELSPLLTDEEVEYMLMDLKRELEGRGLSFETYIEKIKNEKRDLRKEMAPEAEKRVKLRLVLQYIFKTLQITAGDEEMAKAGARLLETSPQENREQLQKQLENKGELYLRLKNNIMLEHLFQQFLDKK